MKVLALLLGDAAWQPYSLLISALLRWRGVTVGRRLQVRGAPRVTIAGRAQDISLGESVQLMGEVDLRNRERGKIIIGDSCRLDHNVRLVAANNATLSIGQSTRIGIGTVINCGTDITIGKKVLISGYSYIQSSNHGMAAGQAIMDQPHTYAPITIGDGAWLGSHVTVLAGITIGPGAVIGSKAVVTKDIPAHAVAVGVPARVIHQREPAPEPAGAP